MPETATEERKLSPQESHTHALEQFTDSVVSAIRATYDALVNGGNTRRADELKRRIESSHNPLTDPKISAIIAEAIGVETVRAARNAYVSSLEGVFGTNFTDGHRVGISHQIDRDLEHANEIVRISLADTKFYHTSEHLRRSAEVALDRYSKLKPWQRVLVSAGAGTLIALTVAGATGLAIGGLAGVAFLAGRRLLSSTGITLFGMSAGAWLFRKFGGESVKLRTDGETASEILNNRAQSINADRTAKVKALGLTALVAVPVGVLIGASSGAVLAHTAEAAGITTASIPHVEHPTTDTHGAAHVEAPHTMEGHGHWHNVPANAEGSTIPEGSIVKDVDGNYFKKIGVSWIPGKFDTDTGMFYAYDGQSLQNCPNIVAYWECTKTDVVPPPTEAPKPAPVAPHHPPEHHAKPHAPKPHVEKPPVAVVPPEVHHDAPPLVEPPHKTVTYQIDAYDDSLCDGHVQKMLLPTIHLPNADIHSPESQAALAEGMKEIDAALKATHGHGYHDYAGVKVVGPDGSTIEVGCFHEGGDRIEPWDMHDAKGHTIRITPENYDDHVDGTLDKGGDGHIAAPVDAEVTTNPDGSVTITPEIPNEGTWIQSQFDTMAKDILSNDGIAGLENLKHVLSLTIPEHFFGWSMSDKIAYFEGLGMSPSAADDLAHYLDSLAGNGVGKHTVHFPYSVQPEANDTFNKFIDRGMGANYDDFKHTLQK
jgi:hypothetical protein